jgi:hypothetical protein
VLNLCSDMSGVKITRAMQHDKILCISYTISWILGTFCLKLFWYKALALNACKKAETFLRTWRISFVQEIPAGTGAASQSPKQSEGAELEEQYGVWTGWHQHCIPHGVPKFGLRGSPKVSQVCGLICFWFMRPFCRSPPADSFSFATSI